ncbi:protein-L-isoaspartate O-methyltransferase [Candidatus Parcubacteria bacterium]|nr:MAG: protein-L-isoaspartate O-methyltransferase [Candidatus Parcubacteria bacterium]
MKLLTQELIGEGILKTPSIIEAFEKIDRKDFVPEEIKNKAYLNAPLPIGFGQTISQPFTVAFMLELLQPEKGNKILDVGSGSGWQTALLCSVVGDSGAVFAIELIPELMAFGRKNVAKYDFIKKGIAEFHSFNAIKGFPEKAPFDRIISAAAGSELPMAWKEQLKTDGRIVAPIKDAIHLFIKKTETDFEEQIHPGFAFVPLVS